MSDRTRSDVFTIGQCATLACLLEATAPKPGNVHRGADFEDLSFSDLAISAVAIGPAIESAVSQPVGQTVLQAVQATRRSVDSNANLGMVLLIAPLAAVPRSTELAPGVRDVLSHLTSQDSTDVYEAIRLAKPGGMGTVERMDVVHAPPPNLLDAMRNAQDRDLIARQYVNGFSDVLDCAVPWLIAGQTAGWTLMNSIVHTHVRMMASFSDSLIARKCGPEVARYSQQAASRVLESGSPGDEDYVHALGDLDFWLRSDGHRRNPGTTADMIAAGLFVALRDQLISPPFH
jgi:triphosphoribosyl-dephospho-CoA synthase